MGKNCLPHFFTKDIQKEDWGQTFISFWNTGLTPTKSNNKKKTPCSKMSSSQ
jgi:hypothetical protein